MEKANKEIIEVFDLIELLSIHNEHSIPVQLAKEDEFSEILEREFKKSNADDLESFKEVIIYKIESLLQGLKDSEVYNSEPEITSKAIEYKRFLNTNLKGKAPQTPKLKFVDALKFGDKKKLIDFLKSEFPEGENSQAAIMVFALIKNNLLDEPQNISAFAFAIMDEWNINYLSNQRQESFLKKYRELKAKPTAELSMAINRIKSFITE